MVKRVYLASLPIQASPLLCFLHNVAQFLDGHFQVLWKEIIALFGCEPLKDIQHATIIVESVRRGARQEIKCERAATWDGASSCPIRVSPGHVRSKQAGKTSN